VGRQLKRVERPEASLTVAYKISNETGIVPRQPKATEILRGAVVGAHGLVVGICARIETTGKCRSRIELRTQRLSTRKAVGEISISTSNSAAFVCQEFAARTTWPHGQANKFTLRRKTFIPTYDEIFWGLAT
jgi:hypothetical protein